MHSLYLLIAQSSIILIDNIICLSVKIIFSLISVLIDTSDTTSTRNYVR